MQMSLKHFDRRQIALKWVMIVVRLLANNVLQHFKVPDPSLWQKISLAFAPPTMWKEEWHLVSTNHRSRGSTLLRRDILELRPHVADFHPPCLWCLWHRYRHRLVNRSALPPELRVLNIVRRCAGLSRLRKSWDVSLEERSRP